MAPCSRYQATAAAGTLRRQHLGVRKSAVVVDRDMQVVAPGARAAVHAVGEDAPADCQNRPNCLMPTCKSSPDARVRRGPPPDTERKAGVSIRSGGATCRRSRPRVRASPPGRAGRRHSIRVPLGCAPTARTACVVAGCAECWAGRVGRASLNLIARPPAIDRCACRPAVADDHRD